MFPDLRLGNRGRGAGSQRQREELQGWTSASPACLPPLPPPPCISSAILSPVGKQPPISVSWTRLLSHLGVCLSSLLRGPQHGPSAPRPRGAHGRLSACTVGAEPFLCWFLNSQADILLSSIWSWESFMSRSWFSGLDASFPSKCRLPGSDTMASPTRCSSALCAPSHWRRVMHES